MVKTGLWALGAFASGLTVAADVVEPGKTIPWVQDVDVVVVGGSSGAIAAACKAAESGAKVFVVAPRPYLGEDMAGSLHLRLEDGDDSRSPLKKAMFAAKARSASLTFTYQADRQAVAPHADPSGVRLCDGKWMDAATESAQFDGDVAVTLDLGHVVAVGELVANVFEREGEGGFCTGGIDAQGSADGQTWSPVGRTASREPTDVHECMALTVPVRGGYRFLKVRVSVGEGYKRQLLGELSVYPSGGGSSEEKLLDQTTPIRVKKALDQALLNAHVPFLTGSLASEPLVDS